MEVRAVSTPGEKTSKIELKDKDLKCLDSFISITIDVGLSGPNGLSYIFKYENYE